MEAEGLRFYARRGGQPVECMRLLRDNCGVNAVRLRVWVNPVGGYNGTADVVAKAVRAEKLGLRTMVDFHFSDTWADPAHQTVPAAWQAKDFDALCTAVAQHVTQTLTALKQAGVTPEWVQAGNEVSGGMLWPHGSYERPAQLAALINTAADAAKTVFPAVKVIVHLPNGHDANLYTWFFDLMKTHGARYDMIGMSLYPYGTPNAVVLCKANIAQLRVRYGKPVMMCEIGLPYDSPQLASAAISTLMNAGLEGIFYWEPQAPPGYNGGYTLGAFGADGVPTEALSPFKAAKKL